MTSQAFGMRQGQKHKIFAFSEQCFHQGYLLGVSQYIDISQYTKNLYHITIWNVYRNILQVFFFLIKLFTFHSILVL